MRVDRFFHSPQPGRCWRRSPSERPPQLKEPNEGNWKAWAQEEDNVVRARLEQGALDSMINLLLFGTSFTTQPRVITMRDFGDPVVQARVTDLVKALRDAKNNERHHFSAKRSPKPGIHPDDSAGLERTKISSWKIFAALCRSRTLFANG